MPTVGNQKYSHPLIILSLILILLSHTFSDAMFEKQVIKLSDQTIVSE